MKLSKIIGLAIARLVEVSDHEFDTTLRIGPRVFRFEPTQKCLRDKGKVWITAHVRSGKGRLDAGPGSPPYGYWFTVGELYIATWTTTERLSAEMIRETTLRQRDAQESSPAN